MNIHKLIGRERELFEFDIKQNEEELSKIVSESKFLVIGGAGTIGQAVTLEIFKRNPKKLHIVDISENNIVELVRDIRSSFGYIEGDFQTYALDVGSQEYDAFFENDGVYDFVLNLSALKHVRSEKDEYTLMRMINVNILNTDKTLIQCINKGIKKYFCVSTDKAANPVSMMGASKRIMEMYIMSRSRDINISTARFANVAFSDGSLLHSFNQRIIKKQPICGPFDIKRYFITPKESGELCLMSCIYGDNRDIFFPKLNEELHLITFNTIAEKYLAELGYQTHICQSEDEARLFAYTLSEKENKWPCFFSSSDTTGEKEIEEFYTKKEVLDLNRFKNFGIIKNNEEDFNAEIEYFTTKINSIKDKRSWTKKEIVDLFKEIIPEFEHKETGKYLNSKM